MAPQPQPQPQRTYVRTKNKCAFLSLSLTDTRTLTHTHLSLADVEAAFLCSASRCKFIFKAQTSQKSEAGETFCHFNLTLIMYEFHLSVMGFFYVGYLLRYLKQSLSKTMSLLP